MNLPLDENYLRRQCPHCERQFKWYNSSSEDATGNDDSPPKYFCPYCGANAPAGNWWTKEQLQHAQELAIGESAKMINKSTRELEKSTRGSFISIKANSMRVPEPHPLYEPHDMVGVQSPCHPEEPFKVTEDWHDPLHCLVCGNEFII